MKLFILFIFIHVTLNGYSQRKYDINEIKMPKGIQEHLVNDTPINGIVYSRYPNGELKSSILYKNGIKKDYELEFYQDGSIKSYKDYNVFLIPQTILINKKGEKRDVISKTETISVEAVASVGYIVNIDEMILKDDCHSPYHFSKNPFIEFTLTNSTNTSNKLHGNYKTFYPNGFIKTDLNYLNGKINGEVKFWFETGGINAEIIFLQGNKNGSWKLWNRFGQIIYEENYKNGKEHGVTQAWNNEGETIYQETWKDGKLENKKCFNENESTEINYFDGKKNGFYRKWTPPYTVEIKYVNDKKHGFYRKWDDKTLIYECEYKNDLKDGIEKEGGYSQITEKLYKNNQLIKLIQKEDGWITSEENYVDGLISSIKNYGLISNGSNTINSYYRGQDFFLNGELIISFNWDDGPTTREEINTVQIGSGEGSYIYLYNNGYLHGEQKEFYEKNNQKVEINFRDNLKTLSNFKYGKENGKTHCYYESGKIKLELNFLEGKLDGIQSAFHEVGPLNDNPKENITYNNGVVNGLRERFYENHQLELKENYLYNKLHGLSIYWDSTGIKKLEINYSNGLLNGYLRRWYNENQLQIEINYSDGLENGMETTWYPDGNIKSQNSFRNGLLNGTIKKWYKGKVLEFEENYIDNIKDGIQREYYSNGKIKKLELWKKGVQISKECWDSNGKTIYCDIIPNNLTIEENGILKNLLTKEIITGNVFIQDENGILEFDCVYQNGLLNGDKKVFYKNGIIKESSNFSYGNLNGLRKTWYEDGTKEYEEIYKKGILDSIQLGFYENGNLKHMLNYKNGKLNGAIKRMHRNGNSCLEEIYYNGILNGKQIGWYENGNLKFEKIFKDGKWNGLNKEYYENGSLKSETTYIENMKIDVAIIWYENGNIMSEFSYDKDKLDGLSKTYHKNGKISSKWKYKDNILISEKCWDEKGNKIICE